MMNLGDGESQIVEFSPALAEPGRVLSSDIPTRFMLEPVVRPRKNGPLLVPDNLLVV
jgi:hypothetical protein